MIQEHSALVETREVGRLEVAHIVTQVSRTSLECDTTPAQHDDPIGHAQRLAGVLLDEQHADAGVGSSSYRPEQALHDQRREPERQLVDEQQARVARERPSERQHLLLSAREEPRPAPQQRRELGEQLGCPGRCAGREAAGCLRRSAS